MNRAAATHFRPTEQRAAHVARQRIAPALAAVLATAVLALGGCDQPQAPGGRPVSVDAREVVFYGWAAGERMVITATANAESDCRRLSRAPCAVVLADGKFDEQAFATFATWLGTRPQAQVREDLLNKIRTNPYQGGVDSIERQP